MRTPHPVVVSRAELLDRTLALRAQLQARGLSRGDCVAVWLPNWSDVLCWQVATASLGAHVVWVNTRYNVDEVAHVLRRARPRVVAVAHDFRGLDLAATLHGAMAMVEIPAPSVAVVAGPHGSVLERTAGYDVGAGAWVASQARILSQRQAAGRCGHETRALDDPHAAQRPRIYGTPRHLTVNERSHVSEPWWCRWHR